MAKKASKYQCRECGWRGDEPSVTDASELDAEGNVDRVHKLVCPKCMEESVEKANGREKQLPKDERLAKVEKIVTQMEAERSVRAHRWAALLRQALRR